MGSMYITPARKFRMLLHTKGPQKIKRYKRGRRRYDTRMSKAEELERKYALLFPHLNERQQHLIAAFDGQRLGPGLTHHNSESGLAGKPCLLVKSTLLDHIFATFR